MKNFEMLWNKAIRPLIDKQTKDKRIQITYGFEKESDACKDVEARYNNLRDETKRELMLQPDHRLDRHKLCACIYIAMVEMKLLKVMNGSEDKDRLVNAYVALLAACKILFFFVIYNAKDCSDFEKFLNQRKSLCFPDSKGTDSSDSYMLQTMKGLCHAQKRGDLNVLSLANIFYLLEVYTEMVYKNSLPQRLTI